MATHGPQRSADIDIDYCLSEFEELDRRRLFGAPALEVAEVEYWLELRARLEEHLGGGAACDTWSGVERREFIRLPTHIHIEFAEPEGAEPQIARDISQGGVFIATSRPLPVGSPVRLQLDHPEAGVTEVTGEVAWTESKAGSERAAGMGIRFGELSREQRQAISRFVQDAAFEG